MGTNVWQFENFKEAFSMNTDSLRERCSCGKQFYDTSDNHWDWEEGEREALEKDPKAVGINGAIGRIEIEGNTEYVIECDCWWPLAKKIIGWLEHNIESLKTYFDNERARYQLAADAQPGIQLWERCSRCSHKPHGMEKCSAHKGGDDKYTPCGCAGV